MVSGGHAYNYAVTLSENTAPAATEIAANLFLRGTDSLVFFVGRPPLFGGGFVLDPTADDN